MSDYRDLLIEGLEHERYAAEQRAEGYLLLLGLSLDQAHDLRVENRRLEARRAILATEYRELHDAYNVLQQQRQGRAAA